MTHTQDIAVLTALRDEITCVPETIPSRTPEQIAALTRVIAHYEALDAATGEDAKRYVDILIAEADELDDNEGDFANQCGTAMTKDAMRAGAAAITALAASEAKVRALTDALDTIESMCTVESAAIRDFALAALKEAGHE